MKRYLLLIYFLLSYPHLGLAQSETCSNWLAWFRPVCQHLHQIWDKGDNELYLSGYAWHNRYKYSADRIDSYNELAWGGGLGKSYFDEKGNWQGLYAFAFLDSHKNVEPIAGYAYMKMAHLTENINAGLGVSAFVTARPDIFHGIPFPGALPWASISYRKATISVTYIPGAQGAGNVLFIVGKWLL